MSDADDPKKRQQSTIAWNPDDLPPRPDTAEAEASAPPPETEPEEDPLLGQLLRGKWRVLKRLGAGSFGTVYKVRDEKGGWIEALKILGVDRITGSEAENARKRFLREAQIMKRLGTESQHIVGLSTYEEDLEAGLIYFLMEFVGGGSLADALHEQGAFPVERTLRLALQVCDALIVAHEGPEGVVHRDLKLENLMLTKDRAGGEIVKVLDFGIAKLAEREADSRLTTVGTLGTPGYAAPEQLRAEAVDARTDLFAFGVILYALLTGRDPWMGRPAGEPTTQIYELMVASDRGEVKPMSGTGVQVPPVLEHIVLRLLRRNPDERFQSARDLKEALEGVVAGGTAADTSMLRVLTEPAGVRVEVRSGRHVVAEGATPCSAAGLEEGTYKVAIVDPGYEPVETVVKLGAGALEDVSLVTRPRAAGTAAPVRSRRPVAIAAGVVLAAAVAGLVVLRPWGRTLDLERLRASAESVGSVHLVEAGLEGILAVGPLSVPFHAPLTGDPGTAVSELRAAGIDVDTSWEVARLIGLAERAQAAGRYFDGGSEDVRTYATRAAALAPDDAAARSLLLKVGERLAWDADAALAEGKTDEAEALLGACREVVADHPRCAAVQVPRGR